MLTSSNGWRFVVYMAGVLLRLVCVVICLMAIVGGNVVLLTYKNQLCW